MEHVIWVHQFNQQAEQTAQDYADTLLPRGITRVCPKAMDGTAWMGSIYSHPLAPSSAEDLSRVFTEFANVGLQLIPWCVPRGGDPTGEANLHADAGNACGGVVIDFEYRYAGFFDQGGMPEAQHYFQTLLNRGLAWLGISPDPRQPGNAYPYELIAGATAFLAQTYWTDFQRPWNEVLDQAWAALHDPNPGVSFEPAFPYNSSPGDMQAALAWAAEHEVQSVSLWRMGVANADQLDAFTSDVDRSTLNTGGDNTPAQPAPADNSTPPPPTPPPSGSVVAEIPGTDLVIVHRGDFSL